MRTIEPARTDEHAAETPEALHEEPGRRRIMRRAAGGTAGGRGGGAEAGPASASPGTSWSFGDAINAGIHGGGQALPDNLRSRFESSLGTDLGGVRVHTGDGAAQATASVNARAFATGQDVVMGAGQYAPETPHGQWLLAHEVAHTVQQRGASAGAQMKTEISEPGDACEVEADDAATAMLHGRPATVNTTATGINANFLDDLVNSRIGREIAHRVPYGDIVRDGYNWVRGNNPDQQQPSGGDNGGNTPHDGGGSTGGWNNTNTTTATGGAGGAGGQATGGQATGGQATGGHGTGGAGGQATGGAGGQATGGAGGSSTATTGPSTSTATTGPSTSNATGGSATATNGPVRIENHNTIVLPPGYGAPPTGAPGTAAAPAAPLPAVLDHTSIAFNRGQRQLDASSRGAIVAWVRGLSAETRAAVAAGRAEVVVRGFASRVGSDATNDGVSDRRRIEVQRLLMSDEGFGPGVHIHFPDDSVGMGESTSAGRDGSDHAQDRRVDIVIRRRGS